VFGSRIRGRSGAILAASLLVLTTVPGLASAANTRSLFLGSPDAQTNDKVLLPTTVSVPGDAPAPINSTLVVVQLKSIDNQTIAHAVMKINWNAQSRTDLSFNQLYDPNGGTDADACTRDGNVITCDYGNLPARAVRTVAVVVDVARGFDTIHQATPLFSASATTNNENGTNQQLFLADSGTFKVNVFNGDKENTFLPAGLTKKTLFTSAVSGDNKLQTTVNFVPTGGKLVAITEGTTQDTGPYQCPTSLGLACQPFFSEVTAGDGAFGDTPFFTWTLTALVPKTYSLSQGFIAHYATGATDPNWTLLFKNKSAFCGLDIAGKIASSHQCIVSATLTKVDKTSNLLVIEAVMDHQGGAKY
jgi:hypothetical protein